MTDIGIAYQSLSNNIIDVATHLYQKSILILHIINIVYALGYLYWQAVGIIGSVTLFSKIKFDGPFHESSIQELQQNVLFFEWFCSQVQMKQKSFYKKPGIIFYGISMPRLWCTLKSRCTIEPLVTVQIHIKHFSYVDFVLDFSWSFRKKNWI